MKTPLRTALAVVLASAALLGCADRSEDDEGDDTAGDVGGSETTEGEPTPMPDLGEQLPDPDDQCAHPGVAGATVWLCSDPLPEPYENERCLWDPEGLAWSCLGNPCDQDTERGDELGLDTDVWVCAYVRMPFVDTCTFDWLGEAPFFDCPAECEVTDFSMTCPDFECGYEPPTDVWICE